MIFVAAESDVDILIMLQDSKGNPVACKILDRDEFILHLQKV
jgi:hypothetical protein